MGEIGITEQPRALGAQPHHLGDDRFIVGRAAVVATHDEAAKHLFAQIAAVGKLQERLNRRARQCDRITVKPALESPLTRKDSRMKSGRPASSASPSSRSTNACSSAKTFWPNAVPSSASRSMISASRFLAILVQRRAGAAEACVIALDHPLLFGVQSNVLGGPHHRVDAPEQGGIGVDLVPVPRDLRRHDALDFQQGIIGMCAGKKMKDVIDPFEGAAATLERGDRIGECRWCRVRAAMAAISAACSASARA